MKKSIKITIPEPCHEDWNKMTPTEKGKFCKVCTKEVHDFTQRSDEEIIKALSNTKNACGRFKKSQVNRTLSYSTKLRKSLLPYAASLLLPAALLATTQYQAQEKLPEKPYTSLGIGKFSNQELRRGKVQLNKVKDSITIAGTVIDNSGLPLPGVIILVKETSKGAQSDFDGNYKITTTPNSILVFSYLGYESKEITISNISSTIDIQLEESVAGEIGDVVIVLGGIGVSKESNPLNPNYCNNSYSLSPEKRALKEKRKEARENNRRFKLLQKKRKKEFRKNKKGKK